VAVLLTRPGEDFATVTTQLENAALKLAELLGQGKSLSLQYSFDGERLSDLANAAGYMRQLRSLCPVAIKVNQNEIHAPDHDDWGVVTCDSCGEQFHIGPNRIFRARTTAEHAAEQLKDLLAEDHRVGRSHQNGYDLPD
jgi:hypothetical protein